MIIAVPFGTGSNKTLKELKVDKVRSLIKSFYGSNKTLKELKVGWLFCDSKGSCDVPIRL